MTDLIQKLSQASTEEWPREFLGRCPTCLDNAYLHSDCNYGPDYTCTVRTARAAIKATAALRARAEKETTDNG